MKTVVLALYALASVVAARAQGTVNFANISGSLNAPIYLSDGVTKISTGYTAELLAGPAFNDMRSVATTGFVAPGYFNGGVVTISNVAPGTAAWCVVQVWPTLMGSFSNAFISFSTCGACSPFQVVLGGAGVPPSTPAPLVGITNSTMIIGGLAVFEEPLPTLLTHVSNTNTLSLIWADYRAYPVTSWRYLLQQSSDLKLNHWSTLTNAPELNSSSISVTVPAPSTKAYFRLLRNL